MMKRWPALSLALCMLLSVTTACGHTHSLEYVAAQPATCESGGTAAHWRCEDCGLLFADEDAQTELASVVTSPLGHSYAPAVTKSSATCESEGESSRRCIRCGRTEITITEALGHSYTAFRQATAPTCEGAGSETRYCTRCFMAEHRPVPALGHSFDPENRCLACNTVITASLMEYEEGPDGFIISGVQDAVDELVIAPYHMGLPVLEIANGAFADMEALRSVRCYAQLCTIGQSAFRGCVQLTDMTIPDSVTSIGDYAFYSCSSLQRLQIGSGLEYLGQSVFYNCSALTEITGESARYTTRANCLFDGDTLILGSNGAAEIRGAKEIGANAFLNMTGLHTITIDTALLRIGDFAFLGCENLQTLLYEGSAAQWQAIEKGKEWNKNSPLFVICADGTVL